MVDLNDTNTLIEEVEFSMEWFCKKTFETFPSDKESKDKILRRMVNLGWLRESEYQTYNDLVYPKDD